MPRTQPLHPHGTEERDLTRGAVSSSDAASGDAASGALARARGLGDPSQVKSSRTLNGEGGSEERWVAHSLACEEVQTVACTDGNEVALRMVRVVQNLLAEGSAAVPSC
jgi:hypothetical protein